MTPLDIAHRRLANQLLLGSGVTAPVEVVRGLGAVQAQDYASAKWAVGLRTAGAVDGVVEHALNDGSILRTHVLRPTWHFVTRHDIRWMLALTAHRVKAATAYYDRKLHIDNAVCRRTYRELTHALCDGKHLTRSELAGVLRRARIKVTGSQHLGHLLMRAELDGVICSGARRGKQITYALFEERVPGAAALDRDEALRMLTERYFATRGPATVKDFAWWSGLTLADVSKGLQIAGRRLERELIDGEVYWSDPQARSPQQRSPVAHLLPNYDEYFIGFKDRTAIGTRLNSTLLVTGGDSRTAHVVVVDGQLVGGWKRTLTKTSVLVQIRLHARLSEAEKDAVVGATRAYGHFLSLPPDLVGSLAIDGQEKRVT